MLYKYKIYIYVPKTEVDDGKFYAHAHFDGGNSANHKILKQLWDRWISQNFFIVYVSEDISTLKKIVLNSENLCGDNCQI